MKGLYFLNIIFASVIMLASNSANAVLHDRGNGLIYDDVNDLTWTQDAGLSGKLSLPNARIWAANLVYGGYSDWRIPTTLQYDDPSCLEDVRDTIYRLPVLYETHSDCVNGEMESLTVEGDPYNNPLFQNVNNSRYWTNTPYRDFIDPCVEGDYCTKEGDTGIRTDFYWQWTFRDYYKTTLREGNSRYVWAVRDGDVDGTPPPPPPPVDPSDAIGEVTAIIFLPALNSGTENIWVKLEYYDTDTDGDLYSVVATGVNDPAIDNENTGTYSATHIHAPSVTYRRLLSFDKNLSLDFVYVGQGDSGEALWRIDSYVDNTPE